MSQAAIKTVTRPRDGASFFLDGELNDITGPWQAAQRAADWFMGGLRVIVVRDDDPEALVRVAMTDGTIYTYGAAPSVSRLPA